MDTNIIYLNHAGTSWPKPPLVQSATHNAASANPTQWPELFRTAFDAVASFFHIDSSRLVLTPSCTSALNLAVMDQDWKQGDRVITSSFEHHALYRNLLKLQKWGVEIVTVPPAGRDLFDLERLETELKQANTPLVAITAACNVTGGMLPVKKIIELSHHYGARVLVDGAQIAGWWDLDLIEMGVDFFTFAGHKGLQAPWGIGGLYVSQQATMQCPNASCEVNAKEQNAFNSKPGYCDAGSVDLIALAGLAAGCQWLENDENQERLVNARLLASKFADAIRAVPGCKLYHDFGFENKMPTVAASFGEANRRIGEKLTANQVITSNGFQCSPQAHATLQTSQHGVLRFSFGPNQEDIDIGTVIKIISSA